MAGRFSSSKGPSQRQLRAGELVRHALVEFFQRGDLRDPALAGLSITVTEVRMAPDLKRRPRSSRRLAPRSRFAKKVLKQGGSLLVMTGVAYLPEVLELMKRHMSYHSTVAYNMPGPKLQIWHRKVIASWKPVLWFVKGKYEGDWITDSCKSAGPDKEHHQWGQSESGMAEIIEKFTYPGQTILDPFCGAGTTGVVALKMDRKFIGIDIDEDAIETAVDRIEESITQLPIARNL